MKNLSFLRTPHRCIHPGKGVEDDNFYKTVTKNLSSPLRKHLSQERVTTGNTKDAETAIETLHTRKSPGFD